MDGNYTISNLPVGSLKLVLSMLVMLTNQNISLQQQKL
jgi:hypothetical protein